MAAYDTQKSWRLSGYRRWYRWRQILDQEPRNSCKKRLVQQLMNCGSQAGPSANELQNQLELAQAKIREQQAALQTAHDQAPAPPAAPRSRDLPEHMRPIMPMTPVAPEPQPPGLCVSPTQ